MNVYEKLLILGKYLNVKICAYLYMYMHSYAVRIQEILLYRSWHILSTFCVAEVLIRMSSASMLPYS